MRETTVSSTLTVAFDGQFWAGTIERVEDGRLSVCRVVFGAEPSNEEVLQFVREAWDGLRFTEGVACDGRVREPQLAGNPKRRQREAAREVRSRGMSTKAQEAFSKQYEKDAQVRKEHARARRDQRHEESRASRKAKARKRHRGR